jgi:membrane fusion protein (multidrug efflux system)
LTEVEVAEPLRKDVPVTSEWIGTTVGYIDAQIHSKVTGYLLSQNYQEGAPVKKGDLLFQVDPRPFQALVNQGDAQLNGANAELTQARADVVAAKAEIERAEAAQVKTQLDVKRYGPLVADGTVSHQEMDDAVQSNLSNLASIAAAKGKSDRAKAAVTAAVAQIGVARSILQTATLNLDFTRVKSPINGLAGIRAANIGDLVGGSQETLLTTVSQIDPIFVQFPISEQEYLGLRSVFLTLADRQKDNLELILSDGEVYPLKGKLDIVGREVEASTGTLRLRGVFANPNGILRPGQYSRIRAATRIEKDALLVPQRAVQEEQGEYEVAVISPDNHVVFHKVRATDRVGSYWLIQQG